MVDMHHEIFPPTRLLIRRSTQDPGRKSDIVHPVTGYLNERQLSLPERKMGKQVMKKYKPAYQGVQRYMH